MINYVLFFFSLAFILVGCLNESSSISDSDTNQISKSLEFPDSYIGYYINTQYINDLRMNGSLKKAQEKVDLSTVEIIEKDSKIKLMTTWGFHEGGSDYNISMTGPKKGILSFENFKDTVFFIGFVDDQRIRIYMGYDSITLVQCEKDDRLINESILPKEMFLDGKQVSFLTNGEIIGLDSIVSFKFNQDYFDAGMDYDMIYLSNSKGEVKEYGYNRLYNEFIIFHLICIPEEEESDYCIERKKGDVFLKLNYKK